MTKLIEMLSINRKPKPLPLGKFRSDSGETLVQFLDRYENYCQEMYPESKEGLLPLLGTYLEGETLEVYKTIVRNTWDYEDAREQLLTWFREEKARENKHETKNFTEARIHKNEPITVYALRLEGLARRAFPGCDVIEMPILRQRFLDSVPNQIKMEVERTVSTIETTMGIKVPWDRLVAIVDESYIRMGVNRKEIEQVVPSPIIDLTEEAPFHVTTPYEGKAIQCCHMTNKISPFCQASAFYSGSPQVTNPILPPPTRDVYWEQERHIVETPSTRDVYWEQERQIAETPPRRYNNNNNNRSRRNSSGTRRSPPTTPTSVYSSKSRN